MSEMEWSHQTVLVTGAGGFIGSHLTERLVTLGARVRALVRYNSAQSRGWLDRSAVKEDVDVILGDVQDRDSLRRACKGADLVFHLAALIGIPYSYHTPLSYIRTNIEGSFNVFQTALEAGAKRVIHTSTSEVYGTAQRVPIDETHPLQGQSPYAATKIGAEKLAEAFSHSYGLPITILRPFNTFGPRQSARAIIPTIITQCLTARTIRLGRVSPTRDFNYVHNVVDGFVRVAETSAAQGRTLNLGSGCETSIKELVDVIARLAQTSVTIEQDEERVRPSQSEVERLLADATAARDTLGWEPSISLEDGLKITIEWMREHLDGYRPNLYAI